MTALCHVKSIEDGQAKEFIIDGESIIVAKNDGAIYAYVNRCPHLSIPLHWQTDDFMDEDGELLRCSTHGALFLVNSGECISGPCLGESLEIKPCRIENNQIIID